MSTRPLALHQMTALECCPLELVALAAQTGCEQVCIFTHSPFEAMPERYTPQTFPVLAPALKGAMRDSLRAHGVALANIEFFPVVTGYPVARYAEALALGAELGARRAVVHIHDHHPARAVQSLGELAGLAAGLGLQLGLEFMGMTPACNSVQRAAWFVDQVAAPNLGIAVDALHLTRTGGTAADVAALASGRIAYAQLCDGRGLHCAADYLLEARDRLAPGEGDFDLPALLAALPPDTPLDVEVPSASRQRQGMAALGRVRQSVSGARRLLGQPQVELI